jgi:RHS repeat-associated protein
MPETITLPGGTTKANTYTALMQLKSLTVKGPDQNPLMTSNYSYSPAGNVTAKSSDQANYTYQYDALYRLTGVANPVSKEGFTYDDVGNRITSADVQGSWSYNGNNELLGYGDILYEYDLNGNTIRKTDQTGTTTYTYDVDDRLIQISNPQSEIHNYYYDPFGKRLSKEVSGVRTYFFYSDEGLIGEYDSTGGEIKTYGYVPDSDWTTKPLFQKMATNYYWYQNDHLGTPQKMVNTNGRIVWSATYGAFGNIQVTTAEIENNLRLPGQYYDQDTEFHYNFRRYFEPKTGRYLSPDPISVNGGVNLFLYSKSNPLRFIDPLGLKAGDICDDITVKRRNINKSGRDKYGHWWVEMGGESYGWWPKYPVGTIGTLFGVEGELNGQTSFGGTATRDAHHGDPADEKFHPKISSSCKTCDDAKNCIRSFARSYSGSWSWPFGQNCRSFQISMMDQCWLEKP